MPWRTPEEPSGWNQWVKTDAPLSPAHSMMALATESAVAGEVVHEGSSSRPAGRPCLARYLSATSPLNRCWP
jgi:DNA-binding transcriptional regulator YdaS (Cro superfamily)